MKKKFLEISLCFILVFSFEANAQNEKDIKLSDFRVGGFELGQSMTEVTKMLGEPLTTKLIPHKSNSKWDYQYYFYKGISFGFYPYFSKTVNSVRIEVPGYKTPRGIEVGDKESEVIFKYGSTKPFENRLIYELYTTDEIGMDVCYAIAFIIEEKIVKQIYVYFAAT